MNKGINCFVLHRERKGNTDEDKKMNRRVKKSLGIICVCRQGVCRKKV